MSYTKRSHSEVVKKLIQEMDTPGWGPSQAQHCLDYYGMDEGYDFTQQQLDEAIDALPAYQKQKKKKKEGKDIFQIIVAFVVFAAILHYIEYLFPS